MSPTQRTLKIMRERGWKAEIVEKFNYYAKIRQDAFGFGDLLCFHPQMKVIALVQTTSRSNMASRRKKILNFKLAEEWKEAGGQIILHGWKGSELKELFL